MITEIVCSLLGVETELESMHRRNQEIDDGYKRQLRAWKAQKEKGSKELPPCPPCRYVITGPGVTGY